MTTISVVPPPQIPIPDVGKAGSSKRRIAIDVDIIP